MLVKQHKKGKNAVCKESGDVIKLEKLVEFEAVELGAQCKGK